MNYIEAIKLLMSTFEVELILFFLTFSIRCQGNRSSQGKEQHQMQLMDKGGIPDLCSVFQSSDGLKCISVCSLIYYFQ